jgi:hypothetical protein
MKNITRMLAVGLLILGDLGLSQAQMAPTRGWPTHDYRTAGLFEEAGGIKYCSLMATDRPDHNAPVSNCGNPVWNDSSHGLDKGA